MEPAPDGVSRRRKGRVRRWAIRLALGLIAAFAVLQLVLLTPWPAEWVAGRLERRLGLEVEIERLGWTPWSGAKVRGVRVFQPGPLRVEGDEWLVDVEEVRVDLAATGLLAGEVVVERLEVERPRLHLRGEMVIDWLRQAVPPPVEVAVVPKDSAARVASASEATKGEAPPVAEARPAEKAEAIVVAEAPLEKSKARSKAKRWEVEIADGEVLLGWGGMSEPLAGVTGVGLDLRKDGGEGTGRLTGEWSVPLVDGAGGFVIELLKEGMAWRMRPGGPRSDAAPIFEAAASALPGVPWQLTTGGGRAGVEWSFGGREIKAEQVAWQGGGGGWVLAPGSWAAGFRAEAGALEVPALGWRGDRAEVVVALERGRLKVPVAKAVGETGSILANGWADAGGARGTVRVVVPPEVAQEIGRRWTGADLPWRPLAPGNRVFLDVGAEWAGGPLRFSLGDGWMEWRPGAGLPEAGEDAKGAR